MSLTAEDLLEIQALPARYSHALDGGDPEALRAIFVENCVLTFGPEFVVEGHAGLTELVENFQKFPGTPRHVVSNTVVDGDGDHATIKAYVHLFAFAGDPPTPSLQAVGVDNDVAIKENGHWKLVSLDFTADN